MFLKKINFNILTRLSADIHGFAVFLPKPASNFPTKS